jgi:hypothetical protein
MGDLLYPFVHLLTSERDAFAVSYHNKKRAADDLDGSK